jgi:carbamoyltransferase
MNVLGISCYFHDAAAALVRDGHVVAAVEEERFTRKKHDNRFPELAVDFCLKSAGLAAADLDLVCYYEKPFRKLERVLRSGAKNPVARQEMVETQVSHLLNEQLLFEEVLAQTLGYTGPVAYSDHHLSHAASSFYVSGFDDAAILTIDGVGEWATTAEFAGHGTEITKLREIRYPHSLGLLYSTVTAFLGFKINNDEYKVMGLASYGQPRYADKLRQIVKFHPDSSFELDLKYFSFESDRRRMFSDAFIDLFGQPRVAEGPVSQEHMDLAASVQQVLEEGMIALGRSLHSRTGLDNVCLAGGVALNSVANVRFIQETPFKHIWIQPAAGDGGGAVGSALWGYFSRPGTTRVQTRFHALLGPEFTSGEIESVLKANDARYTFLEEDDLCARVAQLIAANQIIGWFQGRMEFGPRALGSRSILANACNPAMKDVLNARVKFREDFRPFAPAVLEERSPEYFKWDVESPFMLFVVPVVEDKKAQIPSVTHVDGSARIQTVSRADNPRYYRLIQEVEKRTGVPVVINTSFNIRGEPIVCTPQDAYDCFAKTDIDYLVAGNFLVEKEV